MREKPDKYVQEILDGARMDVDDALEAVRAVERGEAPSGSVIIALTGPNSLSSPGVRPVEPEPEEEGVTVAILITHDENSLHATLHSTPEGALAELREYLNDNPVDYQDPLPEDAPRDRIEWAANDRSQFSWSLLEQKVPGDVL
jgi:hypothetical protein